jgi:hypothetical protein
MAHEPGFPDEVAERREPVVRIVGLCVAGWLVGYLISLISSILFFRLGHIVPELPASSGVLWSTALYGIFFAALGGAVGASFYRKQAIGIGAAIALTIGALGMWSWYITPTGAHWSQVIAILLMAPAAQFSALVRRTD